MGKEMRIGEYIHYKYSNYLDYGLNSNYKGKNQISPEKALANQKNKILKNKLFLNTSLGKQKEELENQINFFFNLENNKFHTLDGSYAQLPSKLQKYAESLILQVASGLTAEDLSQYIIDYITGKVSTSDEGSITFKDKETQQAFQKLRNSSSLITRKGNTREFATVWQINQRVQALLNLRKNAGSLMEIADTNGAAFLKQLDEVMHTYQIIKKDIEAAAAQEAKSNTRFFVKGSYDLRSAQSEKIFYSKSYNVNGKTVTLGSFTEELQALLDKTKYITAVTAQGLLGEVIPVVSQYLWEEFSKKSAEDIATFLDENFTDEEIPIALIKDLKGKVVGKQRSRKISLTDKILTPKANSESLQAQIGDVKVNTSFTNDKVDIYLDLPDGKKMSASVKAVNLKNDIHILSGSDLLKYLQDYPVFANHYLNITARGEATDGGEPGKSLYENAHNTMLLTVAFHALSGGLWAQLKKGDKTVGRSSSAPYFIVNDVSNPGNYKIYYISEILRQIEENIKLFKLENYENVKIWENKWVGDKDKNREDALRRITNLQVQLRQAQLKASISPKALT